MRLLAAGLLLFAVSSTACFALSPAEAEEHYKNGRFAEAASMHQSMVDAGVRDAAVFYNLGNCHFRLGDLGRAVINYRRAQHLAPSDPDIETNLRFAQEKARVAGTPGPGLLRQVFALLPPGVWVGLGMAGWWAGLFLLSWARWNRRPPSVLPIAVCALLCLAGLTAVLLHAFPSGRNEVVALQPVIARFSPMESAEPHFRLFAGTIVNCEPREGGAGWILVRLADKTGWIPSESAARVHLD